MIDNQWIQIIIAAVSGGLLTQVFSFLLGNKKERRDKYSMLFDRLEKDNDRLREEQEKERERNHKELKTQLSRIVQLEKKVAKLHSQIVTLESAHYDHPYPSWLKDTDGVMLFLNRAYEEAFLIPAGLASDDYIGHTDYDVWPEEVAKEFVSNDKKVISTRQTFDTFENVPDGSGEMKLWRIVKYPRYSGRRIIGVAGMAIPINERKDQP